MFVFHGDLRHSAPLALCSQCGALLSHAIQYCTSNSVHTVICIVRNLLYSILRTRIWPLEAHGINIVSKISPYGQTINRYRIRINLMTQGIVSYKNLCALQFITHE